MISFIEVLVKGRFKGGFGTCRCLIGRLLREPMPPETRRPRAAFHVKFQLWNYFSEPTFSRCNRSLAMSILKWALIFFVVSIVAGILGFTGVSAASADVARVLFYIFLVIFIVLLLLGMTIFRA